MSHSLERALCLAAAVFALLMLGWDHVAAQARAGSADSATPTSTEVTGQVSAPNDKSSGNQTPPPKGDNDKKEPDKWAPGSLRFTLLVLLAGGFFGGLIDGFGTAVNYKFSIPHRVAASATAVGGEWQLGFIGNGLVGVLAAFSIFAVAGVVFPGAETMSARDIEPVRLISWSLVAGYLGPRLLRLIADKMASLDEVKDQQKVTEQKVIDNAKLASTTQQKLQESEDANPNMQDAQRWLTAFQVALDLDREKAKGSDYLRKAKAKFDLVLGHNPANVTALIGLANVSAEMAELKELPADALEDWKYGIAKLDDAVKVDPRSAKAHYNRACFKARANACPTGKDSYKTDEIFADLRTAYELQPSFRDYAGHDPDFNVLRQTSGLSPADAALIASAQV